MRMIFVVMAKGKRTMTCKDCVHYKVCVIVQESANKEEDYFTEFGCEDFINKMVILF